MNFFDSHFLALKTEIQKLRRTGILWLCIGAALFIPLLTTIFTIVLDTGTQGNENPWDTFIRACFTSFTSFFYPLFLVLMSTRLVYMEHRADTWKLMETQPVSRLALFLAKWEVAALIAMGCLLFLLLFSVGGGLLVQAFRDDTNMEKHSVSWGLVFSVVGRLWISSLAIISAQYLAGLLIKSFSWPLSIGLIAIIAGSIMAEVGVWGWWPYAATLRTSRTFEGGSNGGFLLYHEKLSIAWTLLLLFLAYRFFRGKSLRHAYLQPAPRIFATVGAIVLFGAMAHLLTKPVVLDRYNKTVIAGKVKSEQPVKQILIARAPAFDTVMLIPVKNGRFHAVAAAELPQGVYLLRAGNLRKPIFLGNNDSLQLEVTLDTERKSVAVRGTRIAENDYLDREGNDFFMLQNMAYSMRPGEYAAEVMDRWKNGLKKMASFTTADNIALSEDFKSTQRKLLAVTLLHFADHYYPPIHAAYFPNDTLKYPSYLNDLRREFTIGDPSLADYEAFRQYYAAQMRMKAGRNDSLYISHMKAIPNGRLRDALLYTAVENEVFRMRDSARRAGAFEFALGGIGDVKLRNSLSHKWERIRSLQRNSKAPAFAAEGIHAAAYDMSRLANRYLVIDVWATWCAPCKKEAPFFAELAERYTSEGVAFISVSIDENKDAWRMAVAGNRSRVLQLWAKDAEEGFAKAFAIRSIPRFMLLSPKGTIIHADLPPPSDPEFEAILVKEIPQLQFNARY